MSFWRLLSTHTDPNLATFNEDISGWNVSAVTSFQDCFFEAAVFEAAAFNANISGWDVSYSTHMARMFTRASSIDQDLSQWDVSGVTAMWGTFRQASKFNADISSWNVGAVTKMATMFLWASSFNQDLSGWDVDSLTNAHILFKGSPVSAGLCSWRTKISSSATATNMFEHWHQLPFLIHHSLHRRKEWRVGNYVP